MKKYIIQPNCNAFEIYFCNEFLGKIITYRNSFHAGHCYLKLDIDQFAEISANCIFDFIQDSVKQPLQIMLESTDTDQIQFVQSGGFKCMRKCYEREFSKEDCKVSLIPYPTVPAATISSPIYLRCAQLLYRQYQEMHRNINPLTADFDTFCAQLPEEVLYQTFGDEVVHFAFVEENEIAYIGTTDKISYPLFLQNVISVLLASYQTVCFEADDCDEDAMILKHHFFDADNTSYNTYIR